MDLETDRIAVGIRFEMSKLGAVRCPSLADKLGIVVGLNRHNTGITVLFDGNRRPACLHRDYIYLQHLNTAKTHNAAPASIIAKRVLTPS